MSDQKDNQVFDLVIDDDWLLEGGQYLDLFDREKSIPLSEEAVATSTAVAESQVPQEKFGLDYSEELGREYLDYELEAILNQVGEENFFILLSDMFGPKFTTEKDGRSVMSVLDSVLHAGKPGIFHSEDINWSPELLAYQSPMISLFSEDQMLESTTYPTGKYSRPYRPAYADQAWYKNAINMIVATDFGSVIDEVTHHYQYNHPDWMFREFDYLGRGDIEGNWTYEKIPGTGRTVKQFKEYDWTSERVDVPPEAEIEGDWLLDEDGKIESWRLNYRVPGTFEYEAHSIIGDELIDLFRKLGLSWEDMDQEILGSKYLEHEVSRNMRRKYVREFVKAKAASRASIKLYEGQE